MIRRFAVCATWSVLGALATATAGPVPDYSLIDLSQVDPPFRVQGLSAFDELGSAMATGDLDGDGLVDLAVSAPGATLLDRGGEGGVYLIENSELDDTLILDAPGADVAVIVGAEEDDALGAALAAGDFNGDGFDDVAIGAPQAVRFGSAQDTVFIVYGPFAMSGETIDLLDAGRPVTELLAPLFDIQGQQVSQGLGAALAAGDFDNDGLDDLAIGAPGYDPGQGEDFGRVYLLYGRSDLQNFGTIDLIDAFPGEVLEVAGGGVNARHGFALAMGDADGDLRDDLAIGAPGYEAPNSQGPTGRAYVVYGRQDRPAVIDLMGSPGPFPAFTVLEGAPIVLGEFGASVAFGNGNGDGRDDLLIGAPNNPVFFDTEPAPQGTISFQGRAYIVGGDKLRPPVIDLSAAPGSTFGVYEGNSTGDALGTAVHFVDLNADGYEDWVMSAPGDDQAVAPNGRPGSGVVYVVFGGPVFPAAPVVLTSTTPNCWRFLGARPSDGIGQSLAAGDLNANSYQDLLIGTPNPSSGEFFGEVVAAGALPLRPRLLTATAAENGNLDRRLEPGDQILLLFDRSITITPGTVEDADWFITNGGSFGTDATVQDNPADSNSIVITLGSSFNRLIIAGEDPAVSTAIDLGALRNLDIRDPNTGAPARDNGVDRVDDVAVDLRWRFVGIAQTLDESGGTAGVEQNDEGAAEDYQYTQHRLNVPDGSLVLPTRFEISAVPDSLAFFGLTTAFNVSTDSELPNALFRRPAILTLGYREEDIDFSAGQTEGMMRPVQLTSEGPIRLGVPDDARPRTGAFTQIVILSQDTEENTVTIGLKGLNPSADPDDVGTFATIPINPVEQRNLFLVPAAPDQSATVILLTEADEGPQLNSGPNGAYLLHAVEFPGFVETTQSNPSRIEVTIRAATLFERTWPAPEPGANLFPDQSGALFTIQTRDAGGNPIAFSQPVNIAVQYIPRTDPALTDVVAFDGATGQANRMRIVRSRVDFALGPNFQFVPGLQTNSLAQGVMRTTGVTNLTDANGLAVWGAVLNPAYTPPSVTREQLIQYLLGQITLDVEQQAVANTNGDGRIDAADLVLHVINNP